MIHQRLDDVMVEKSDICGFPLRCRESSCSPLMGAHPHPAAASKSTMYCAWWYRGLFMASEA